MKKGDALRFIVHKRGNIFCDTTGWDPVIAYTDGQRFQASASFAAKKQGEGGWFYEMLGQGEPPPPTQPVAPVPSELKQELARLAGLLSPKTDLELLLLALEEWWRDDKLTDAVAAYTPAVPDHLQRARRLAAELGITSDALEKLSSVGAKAGLPDVVGGLWEGCYKERRSRLNGPDLGLRFVACRDQQQAIAAELQPGHSV